MDVTIAWSDRLGASSHNKSAATWQHRVSHEQVQRVLIPYYNSPQSVEAALLCMQQPANRVSPDASMEEMPGDQNHAIDACSTGACSGDVSPYDSGDDGVVVVVGGGGDELNAGEAVDMKLFERWTTSEAGLRVDAGELEQFGRSKSF
jgi:hypothetical protein